MRNSTISHRRARRAAAATAVLAAISLAAVSAAGAASSTRRIRANFTTTTFSGAGCPSPIDLCAEGTIRGTLNGPVFASATSITPTSQPGVVVGVADIVIHDVRGDLFCTESFLLNATPGGDGEEGVICEFTGGTRAWANVSGYFNGHGSTPPGQASTGTLEGKLILP